MKRTALLLAFFLLVPFRIAGEQNKILTWGDQGDGTYKNPILKSDFSDPDILRHGDDFYLIASDFHFVGMQILHSKDLVNWKIIGQIFDRLVMDPKYDAMRGYSQGTWAPSIRFHNGEFYVYVCTPQEGLFMWHAKNPEGPWSKTITVKAIPRWEDPCPFWDEDGQAYLVHSHVGAGPLILHKMSEDGTKLLDEGKEIYRGSVSEGPKIYKRNGYYYISLPEGGVDTGGQTVLRSRNIYGPYERKQVFPLGSPHQGGMVELKNGETWFISFKSSGYLGRICYLNPVKWVDDWPVFGDNGKPVEKWKKPDVGKTYPVYHQETSDEFTYSKLSPVWQWNHNPIPDVWSLTERPGWLRLKAQPAVALHVARNTLTQKIWDSAGTIDVKLDVSGMKDGQRAGFAFMSGSDFGWMGVVQEKGIRRIMTDQGEGPVLKGNNIWFRSINDGDAGKILYSPEGKNYDYASKPFPLFFRFWKGARIAIFSFGPNGGFADFDYVRYDYNSKESLGINLKPVGKVTPSIDRKTWVARHNPKLTALDVRSPFTVGNGGFAFTTDITGLQTFADHYYKNGMPLETLSRWAWHSAPNPNNYKLADANKNYKMPDGRELGFPTNAGTPAVDWLRKNPHNQPLGQLALEWVKDDGTVLVPEDIQNPEQTLDMYRGVINSRFKLGKDIVSVTTVCAPDSDTIGLRINSPLVREGKLRVRLAFPRGHDMSIKNTPPLDWSHPESHESKLIEQGPISFIQRTIDSTRYTVVINAAVTQTEPHAFRIAGDGTGNTLDFSVQFLPGNKTAPVAIPSYARLLLDSAAHWEEYWDEGAALDFSGSTHPLAQKLEERVVRSLYLMAVQMAGDVPPQESGLAASTWYGKHHTEMIWWNTAHFALWGHDKLLEKNLDWYRAHLPEARALAASRGLKGARWAKMVGPDDRESPGGNPLIVWNQPHLIYLCELLYQNKPMRDQTLAKYRDLVLETAAGLASMVNFNETKGRYELGPPLWIAQEIYDPATSRNPAFELSYWRYALGVAQQWRERLEMARDKKWDDIITRLSPLPVKDGKYVALESNPDTWDNVQSRQDHPSMLMPLGFLPGGPDVDRETMARTLDAVLKTWDWETKIWGWDYPMIAMTAAKLGRFEQATEILLRDGPNNRYLPNGYCPQKNGDRPYEIAAYLPANGAFLSAVALMFGGNNGQVNPSALSLDGWKVRLEGQLDFPEK